MKKLPKNKKGFSSTELILVGVPLMLLILILALVWTGRIGGIFGEETTIKQFEQRLESCIVKGKMGQLDGTPYPDFDKDGLPDYCDNCPNLHNFDRDITNDEDTDGFPEPKDSNQQQACCLEYKPLIGKDLKKICEDEKNTKIYGPTKLFSTYLETKKV